MVPSCLSIILEHLDAEKFLINFLMYVQITSGDIYIYHCPKFYTKCNKPSKLKVPTKYKARSLRTSLWL